MLKITFGAPRLRHFLVLQNPFSFDLGLDEILATALFLVPVPWRQGWRIGPGLRPCTVLKIENGR